MYRTIIELKNISNKTLDEIKNICISAHNNRDGKVDIKEISKYYINILWKHYLIFNII